MRISADRMAASLLGNILFQACHNGRAGAFA
jgi:hypothetical protein